MMEHKIVCLGYYDRIVLYLENSHPYSGPWASCIKRIPEQRDWATSQKIQ